MPTTLVVRNFTSKSLLLHSVERLPHTSAKNAKKRAFAKLDRVKPGLSGDDSGDAHSDGRSSSRIRRAQEAKSMLNQSINIPIHPFALVHTSVVIEAQKDVYYLIFRDTDGNTFTFEVPTISGHMEDFAPRDSPTLDLTGLYFDSGLLAIFRNRNMKQWMRHHSGDTPLEVLSIPGTHNSPTYRRALPSVRCQAVSVKQQLENGVRFLDVRLQVDKPDDAKSDSLSLVHSAFSVALSGSKKFRVLYEEILEFLAMNPSETIILSLKREGTGHGTDANLAQRLHDHYIDDRCWVTKPGIPYLGEARGKIVLLRRFNLNEEARRLYWNAWGINARVWADNSPNSKAGDIQVQDFYEVLHTMNIEKKIQYIRDHCERSKVNATFGSAMKGGQKGPREPLFLNFFSASNFWKKGCWPEKLAASINPVITRYLCETQVEGKRCGLGVMVCDWVGEDGDWGLIRTIVAMNEELLLENI